jgi:predicted permease
MSAIVLRAYRRLLHLLPEHVRREHGAEMVEMLEEELDSARARGRWAYSVTSAAVLWDIVRRIPYEHARRAITHGTREPRMQSFLSDIRFAVRSFARQPGSTALLLLTLALAVAANTAVFTLINGLFLRPFPVPEPSRLVYLNEKAPKWNLERTGINYPDFVAWRAHGGSLQSMALWSAADVNLTDGATSERVAAGSMTYDLPAVLQIAPVIGRTFTADEDRPNGPKVVMLGYDLWKSRCAEDPAVLGKTLRINSQPYTIIGVLPASISFLQDARLWTPLDEDPVQKYESYSYDGIARLRDGATLADAQRDLDRAHLAIWNQRDTARTVSPTAILLRDRFAGPYHTLGTALGLAVVLVLLIACANVGGAMLARSIQRRREIGIRVALGASGGRIARQLLTESLALAVVAGVLGIMLGQWGVRAFVAANPDVVPDWLGLTVDVRTAVFSVALIGVAAVLFGVVPVMHLRKQALTRQLVSGGTRTSGSVPERRMLDLLVGTEVALAVVLLVCAGLLLRSYGSVQRMDPGFRADGVASFRIALPRIKYKDGLARKAFFETLQARLAAVPGVDHAGAITCPPLGCHWGQFFEAEGGAPLAPNEKDPVSLIRFATSDYLATMGITLAHGRFFASGEGAPGRGPRPVVINEEMAHRFWPGVADPTGRRLRPRGDTSSAWATVIGVVRDVKHYGLTQPMIPGLYLPIASMDSSSDFSSLSFEVHTTRDAAQLMPTLRSVVRELDPELPVYQATTMRAEMEKSLMRQRTPALALLGFAVIALILAVGGVYAVLTYVVGRRRHEIGIRMALGAQRGQVVALVVRQGLVVIAMGMLVGAPVAMLVARALRTMLVGVSEHDAVTYTAVIAVLLFTGAVAAWIPARRAADVDPRSALSEGT